MAEKTAAEAAAAAEKALNRLGEDIRALRGGAHEIRIVLEPESLGTLIISVIKTENGVSAKIRSEDKSVVAAISDQLQKLITGMENKGIQLKDVDVIYSQAEQNRGFGQNGFAQGGGGSHRGYAASAGQAQSSDAPAEDIFTGYYSEAPDGGSTVDYTV
jgi:flagellar hook-length control protein FliK